MATKHPKNSRIVKLEIRKSSRSAPWINVKVNNDQYAYRFTGGDTGRGNVNVSRSKNPGRHHAQVTLIGPARYSILACTFGNDTNNQLGWDAANSKIRNLNTMTQDAKYTIIVVDSANGNCVIPCDPGVKNKP